MKITLTKEQMKNQDFPDAMVGKLTKKQAEVIAKIIFDLINDDLLFENDVEEKYKSGKIA